MTCLDLGVAHDPMFLKTCIIKKHQAIARLCIQQGADVNRIDENGVSPLM